MSRGVPQTASNLNASATTASVTITPPAGRNVRILYIFGSCRVGGAAIVTQRVQVANVGAPGLVHSFHDLATASVGNAMRIGAGETPIVRPPQGAAQGATTVFYSTLNAAGTGVASSDIAVVVVYDFE